ncbi:hypothetical protein Syun_001282 [Stephania yunnanensis]|uniref:Uncharacterized protein n=1 Tax=Stephania yunnanensis TaxID=152371 RepID=A0AAP0LF79_9MAGN
MGTNTTLTEISLSLSLNSLSLSLNPKRSLPSLSNRSLLSPSPLSAPGHCSLRSPLSPLTALSAHRSSISAPSPLSLRSPLSALSPLTDRSTALCPLLDVLLTAPITALCSLACIGRSLMPNGAMKIIDKKENIFKLSQGEYIAVENLENTYNRCPIIDSIWVYGNNLESFLVAVVVPNKTTLEDWAETHNKSSDYQSLCISPRARKYILDELNSVGKKHKLRGFEMLKAIHLEPNPFNIKRDLITPTFKLKRPQLLKYYEEYIDQLYNEAKGGATIAREFVGTEKKCNGSETKLLYSVSDPLLIRDGSETEYNNFVSDPLLIRDGSETEYNNSVSDPLLIRDGSEMESNNSVTDPLLIRDGSETEYNNSVSDLLLIRDGSET